MVVPLKFNFVLKFEESQTYESWEILFHMSSGSHLFHLQPPLDRQMASGQRLILHDIPPSYSKWTHFTLDLSVCISSVMHVLSGSVEHNEESSGYSTVILTY